jgi:hypothetical protein
MAKDSDQLAGAFEKDRAGGVLSGLFAEENELDRRSLWRIGSWGAGAVAAVTLAVLANESSLGWRREQVAAADLARQAQQIQSLARESQVETRRLASAIDTLNGDRDRLYSRVTVVEQGLDSVTGAIARQSSAGPSAPVPAAAAAKIAATPAATPPAAAPGATPATSLSAIGPSPTASSTAASSTPTADPQAAPKAQAAAPAVAAVATTAAILSPEKPRPVEPAKPEQVAIMGPPPPQAQAVPNPPLTATPPVAAKSMMAPPDPAASKLIEPAKAANVTLPAAAPSAWPDAAASDAGKEASKEEDASKSAAVESAAPEAAVQRTDFAVDLGGANSVGGLRALWRGLLKSNLELSDLRPIIMIKESHTGLGMQLRLAAGPLKDAAAAAKICAALTESERPCETTVFDGQRLAMKADDAQGSAQGSSQGSQAGQPAIKPTPASKGGYYRRGSSHHSKQDSAPEASKQESSTFSSLFGISKR